MFRKICTTLVIALAASVMAPLPAEAQTTPVTTTIDGRDILWIEAAIEATDAEVVKITVRAPSKSGGRELWQRCRLNYSGPGTYRCGIDVAADSLARKRLGTWGAGVSIDGDPAGRAYFSIND